MRSIAASVDQEGYSCIAKVASRRGAMERPLQIEGSSVLVWQVSLQMAQHHAAFIAIHQPQQHT